MRSFNSSAKTVTEKSDLEFDDGRYFSPNAVRQITQQWVENRMKLRESDFTENVVVNVFCGTWNVNAKKLDEPMNEWLLPRDYNVADIYALGFQEIVDLNAMNVALDGTKTKERSAFWKSKIISCLQTTGFRFVLINERTLDVRTSSIGVGLMGVMGNKGGVGIRMSVYDSSICFLCSHLAAHRENVAGRNADVKNIIDRTIFISESTPSFQNENDESSANYMDDTVIKPKLGASLFRAIDLTILQHEIVFWLGDLNYRMNEELTKDDIFQLVKDKNVEMLNMHDQLNIERKKGHVFNGFEEGKISFLPTYKFQPGTDIYEARPEKKQRAPAYCDRILWRTTNDPRTVRLVKYKSCALQPSDHKPVSALFNADLRIVVTEKESSVYQELMSKLDIRKKLTIPELKFTGLNIEIKDAKFEVESSSTILIENVGDCIAYWHFVSKVDDSKVSKPWIKLSSYNGLLLPGESVTLIVTIIIGVKTAQDLNQGKDTLDDTLILRIENSHDVYVSINANYLRSCYGMSLDELVYTHAAVRSTMIPSSCISNISPISHGNDVVKLSIPKELWRLLDALWFGDALREKDLFSLDCNNDELRLIRESLDTNSEFPKCTPHSLAKAFTTLIHSLSFPLIPPKLCPATEIDISNLKIFARKFLELLPSNNYSVFIYIISFFRQVLAESEFNRSSPNSLLDICINMMTLSPNDFDISKEERQMRILKQLYIQPVLLHFLCSSSI